MLRGAAALLLVALWPAAAYRVVQDDYGHQGESPAPYFEPYHPGYVGTFGDPTQPRRWRVNEGNPFMNAQPNIYEGVHARRTYAMMCVCASRCPALLGNSSNGLAWFGIRGVLAAPHWLTVLGGCAEVCI